MKRFAVAIAALLALVTGAWADDGIAIKSFVSAAAESSHVLCDATGSAAKKAPCFIRTLYVTSGAAAGYLLTFDAIAAPANGAVLPRDCVVVPANTTVGLDFGTTSEPFVTGLTAVYSTTGCFTQTLSATAFFKGRVQ